MFRIWPRKRVDVAFVWIIDSSFSKMNGYYLLPPVLDGVAVYKQLHENDPWLARGTN